MRLGNTNLLEAWIPPSTDHKQGNYTDQKQPRHRKSERPNRRWVDEDNGGYEPSRRGYGHSHEVFPVGPPWVLRHRVRLHVETSQAHRTAEEIKESDQVASAQKVA